MEKVPITRNGLERLKQELKHLTAVERPAIQKAIAEARAHGDLRENAEYHAAKERQGFIEGRIGEINARLGQLHVVDPAQQRSDTVTFGATVTITNVETEETQRYQIVGPDEADLEGGRISYQTPIARALIGRSEGDVVTITVPKGTIEVEISQIEFV